jgi:hypothetical protein
LPTREVLTPAQRADFLHIPEDIPVQEIERFHTFSAEQQQLIRRKRRPHNRLGFAVVPGQVKVHHFWPCENASLRRWWVVAGQSQRGSRAPTTS